jgi:KDO2-lipid IV(A) lauroyltransferase
MSRRVRKIWRKIRSPFGVLAIKCVLPAVHYFSLATLQRFGARMGSLAFTLLRRERRQALNNLTLVFGTSRTKKELLEIARESFITFGRSTIECGAYAFLKPDERAALMELEGKEHLDNALKNGRGVIGLTAHFGNFMTMSTRLADAGYDVSLVVKQAKDSGVEVVFQELRNNMGFKTIVLNPRITCARMCMQALKRNGVLILLADQHYRQGGVPVNFMGHTCMTAPGAATLAITTGAAVLPMFVLREPTGYHRLIIREPVPLVQAADKQSAIVANTQLFTNIIAAEVMQHPGHWSWMHRRWRIKPK